MIDFCHFLVSHMNFQLDKVGRGMKKVENPCPRHTTDWF